MCDDLPSGWVVPQNKWYLKDEDGCIVAEVNINIYGGYTFFNRISYGTNFSDTREEIFTLAEESVRLAKERQAKVYKGV